MLIIIMYSIQSITNTFQGILISDGSSSYAVFIYDCSNMEWGGGVIGWQQSTTQYASYTESGLRSSNRAVCGFQTSSYTTLVYKICECTSLPSLTYTECISLSLTLTTSFLRVKNNYQGRIQEFRKGGSIRISIIHNYNNIYRQCGPVVRLGGLAPARPIILLY